LNTAKKTTTLESNNQVIEHLHSIISDYLEVDKSRSINALSKKCSMSEATLRRIYKKQIKFIPNISTLLDILTKVCETNSILKISKKHPGPIANHLRDVLPDSNFIEIEYSTKLNNEFDNSTKYLIYKLSSNSTGVTKEKVQQLFGKIGLMYLTELIESEYVYLNEGVYKTTKKHFQGNQSTFNKNFKSVSDFIKPYSHNSIHSLNSIRVNYSESVSEKTYKEIVNIQKKALEKIRDLMADEKNSGTIPAFLLVGFDTLDSQSFEELSKANKKRPQIT